MHWLARSPRLALTWDKDTSLECAGPAALWPVLRQGNPFIESKENPRVALAAMDQSAAGPAHSKEGLSCTGDRCRRITEKTS
jgi:hypothetical protein